MYKKLTALVLSAMMLVPINPVFAEENNSYNTEAFEILEQMNIIPDRWKKNFAANSGITRGSFSQMLCELINTDAAENQETAVKLLKNLDAIEEFENFDYNSQIKYEDAVKMIIAAAGYTVMANQYGGYPNGYIKAAREKGFLDKVSGSMGEPLSCAAALQLVYNAMTEDMMELNALNNNEWGYSAVEGKTIISKYRHIYFGKGQVTANNFTKLDSPDYWDEDGIIIDGDSYIASGCNEYLGYYVSFFYEETTDGDMNILGIAKQEKYNNTEYIDGALITEISDRFDRIEYLKTEDSEKTQKVKISPSAEVIYNGKAYSEYTKEDFIGEMTDITLLDYDNDNVYDIIFIKSYEAMVVDRVSQKDMLIYNKYTYPGATASVDCDETDSDYYVNFWRNGTELGMVDIEEGDVICVARSKGDIHYVIEIQVSVNTVSGTIQGINEGEGTVTVDGTEYDISEVYKNALGVKASKAPVLSVGTEYKLYLDLKGNLIAAELAGEKTEEYGYLFKAAQTEENEEEYFIKYLSEDGDYVIRQLAEKVKFNNGTPKVKAKICYDALIDADGATIRQLIRFKTDNSGKIKELLTPVETASVNENILTKGSLKKNKYFAANRSMQGEVYLNSDTIVFQIPADDASAEIKNNEDYYSLISMDEISYNYIPYDMDEFSLAKVITIVSSTGGSAKTSYFLVKDTEIGLNSDDEPVTKISGKFGAFENVSLMGYNENSLAGVKKGDYIKVYLNAKGTVNNFDYIYNVDTKKTYTTNTHANWGASEERATGLIEKIDYEKGFMNVRVSDTDVYAVKLGGKVTIYNQKTGVFEDAATRDLLAGDWVVMNLSYYNLTNVIAYRFKD